MARQRWTDLQRCVRCGVSYVRETVCDGCLRVVDADMRHKRIILLPQALGEELAGAFG